MKNLKGTSTLVLVALRRDRIQLPAWIIAIAAFMALAVPTWTGHFAIEEELRAATEIFVATMAGRLFGIASGVGIGQFVMLEGFVILALLAAVMSFLTVTRHTRQNEDNRRAELIGSSVVGQHAGIAAALIVTISANIVLAIVVALVMIANSLPTEGAFAMSLGVAGVGICFAGVAAVTAQIFSSSRAARGIAGAVLGLTFVLQGIGNVLGRYDEVAVWLHSAWPSWLSPIGWGQQMRPFAENHWWMLGLFAAFFLVLTATAFYLYTRRDMGRGLIPEKRGPSRATSYLLSPTGLTWRLQRGLFFGWATGAVALGSVFGSISGEIEVFMVDSEAVAELFMSVGGTDVVLDAYFTLITGIIGVLVAAYTVQVLLRMRREETDGGLECILTTAVSRQRWMMGYIANAVLGTIALLLLAGLSAGLSAGLVLNDTASWVADVTTACLLQLPAILVIGGISLAAFSFLPRRVGLFGWGAFAISLITGPVIGEMIGLPQVVQNASPFTHTPLLPSAEFTAIPILAMLFISLVFVGAGLLAFRRRNTVLHTS